MKFVPLHLVKALKEGRRIGAKVAPEFEHGVAWVWVGPTRGDLGDTVEESKSKPWRYMVQYFEAPKDLIDREFEVSDEELLHNERYERLQTLEEVDEVLGRLLADPGKLKLMADYPDYFPF